MVAWLQLSSGGVSLFGLSFAAFYAWLIGTGMGAWGASMPDVLEPSKRGGPNHRSFFHSIVVLAGMCYLIYAILTDQLILKDRMDLLFILPFVAGYVSHLAVDWRSPKRLPFLL